jgi:hypothetical protein
MITPETTATSTEICALAGFSPQRLGVLEREGVIRRSGPNRWPLVETISKLFEHLRSQRKAVSASRARWEQAKAKREELRIQRESNELVRRDEFAAAWQICNGILNRHLHGVASRCTRDIALRQVIEDELAKAVNAGCDEFEKQAASLEATGQAAPVR